MDSQDRDVLATLQRWHEEGHHAVLVTLAQACGSTPRSPGAWLAVRADGLLRGSVSGGCIEDDLVARMRSGALFGDRSGERPFVLRYGENDESARRFGLPCGGVLELVVEPAPEADRLEELARRVAAGELIRRSLDMASGKVSLHAGASDDSVHWDGQTLISVHGPHRRMLLIGAGPISRVLAQMAPALDFAVSVCDPRDDYASEWNVADCPLVSGMPDDAVTDMRPDVRSAVIALTHDPKLDDMALLEALTTPAFYVGALGSLRNNQRRRERMAEHFQISSEQLARLHGPVGLPLGSRTPPEIAVAILADIVAVSRGIRLVRASDQ
ncbi:MAG: XdhC family protein [Rhodocyclaceae bacterium]|nr:XdhC family protein [Rhodocyclaceae bacterium]